MTTEATALDRRHRRRQETIEEVLDIAVGIMAEEGVAGLSLGEIARRMGIRPPSLYVYFPSKHALYDALFKRGWELLLAAFEEHEATRPADGDDLVAILTAAGQLFVHWSVEHLAYAQLLFWRPVPGFRPSEDAYQPAVALSDLSCQLFARLQQRGLIRPNVDVELLYRQWTILVAGVVSQQLANAPEEPVATGRFTTQIPALAAMFAAYHANPSRPRAKRTAEKSMPARRGHAGHR
jgi:AcrR family transcriptional regulator